MEVRDCSPGFSLSGCFRETCFIPDFEDKIDLYSPIIANPALKGSARDVILGLLSDEHTTLKVKQEEKSLVEAGIVDVESLAKEAEKILAWCKTVE
ncbi:MAG TPA: hypothetical protein VFN35_02385 [Ktedonobacteraceae bacterium]|nr:hypothetical protein [Ktedonobacteraceae bacterium]